ncbi:hypothetical protein ACIBH1_46230 [Nonomuraea sp. NPDC050663]|uniref:hypothetical protein n=1 Tax=Nonomuraea sp. NPDC050663 TaxID=3364370 RepID=UPI0037B5803F
MNTPTKLGLYGAGLALIFGTSLTVGNAVGDVTPADKSAAGNPKPAEHGHAPTTTATATASAEAGHGDSHEAQPASSDTPGGLQVSQGGYTLTPLTTSLKPGKKTDFRFSVTGPDGKPVTDYSVEHEKKLHFIVVSRDLASFQHLHPEEAGGGVWSVPLTLPQAGVYRAFADFKPTGGSALTLGTDLYSAGKFAPAPLPGTSRTATVGPYTVTLDGDVVPGQSSKLTLRVTKDGKPVTDLQPYLGAYGHLVALRAGDLAYLHVHPEESETPGPEIVFYAEVPSDSDYRLFLDFKHGDAVHTADFTLRSSGTPLSTGKATPPPGHSDDHDH